MESSAHSESLTTAGPWVNASVAAAARELAHPSRFDRHRGPMGPRQGGVYRVLVRNRQSGRGVFRGDLPAGLSQKHFYPPGAPIASTRWWLAAVAAASCGDQQEGEDRLRLPIAEDAAIRCAVSAQLNVAPRTPSGWAATTARMASRTLVREPSLSRTRMLVAPAPYRSRLRPCRPDGRESAQSDEAAGHRCRQAVRRPRMTGRY